MSRTSTRTLFRAADWIDLAFLNGAQELDLRVQRQFADLVEEKRAAIGLDELADVFVGRAGEGALLVAEQDRFDEILRQRPAIDGDEGFAAPVGRRPGWRGPSTPCRRPIRPRSGRECSTWRRVRRAAPPAPCLRERVTRSLNVSVPAALRPMRADLVLERVEAQRVLDRNLQTLGADRFDDEIERAGAHGGDHGLDRTVRGLHDHRRGRSRVRACGRARPCRRDRASRDRESAGRPAACPPPASARAPVRRLPTDSISYPKRRTIASSRRR